MQHILKAAIDEFFRAGVAGAKLYVIAMEAGVSKRYNGQAVYAECRDLISRSPALMQRLRRTPCFYFISAFTT